VWSGVQWSGSLAEWRQPIVASAKAVRPWNERWDGCGFLIHRDIPLPGFYHEAGIAVSPSGQRQSRTGSQMFIRPMGQDGVSDTRAQQAALKRGEAGKRDEAGGDTEMGRPA
jgi:hypothetical protein